MDSAVDVSGCVVDVAKKLQQKDCLVLYENRIYKTSATYIYIYFHDYFASKLPGGDNNKIFQINTEAGTIDNYEWKEGHRKEMYKHLIKTLKFINEADVDSVVRGCIQTVYDAGRMVTAERLRECESYHRSRLVDKVYGFLNSISDTMYIALPRGSTRLLLNLDSIRIDYITNYGKFPIYKGIANQDGKVRTETEYIYYLLEPEFKKGAADNTDDHSWFVLEIFDIIKKAYSFLLCSYKDGGGLIPSIYLDIPVNAHDEHSLI